MGQAGNVMIVPMPLLQVTSEHAGDAICGVGRVRMLCSGSLVSYRGKCAEV